MSANDARKVRIAICFHDNDTECLRALETHLSPITRDGTIELWHRLKVLPGQPYEFALRGKLEQADIVILLVSADFNASWDARISAAVKMAPNATTRVIPIILRPCVWSDLPFYGLQPVPSDGQTLMEDGRIVEERFHRAALAVRAVIADFQATRRKDIEPSTATAHSVVGTIAQLERERYWFTRAASCDVNTGRPLLRVGEAKETPTPRTTPATEPTERHAPTTIDKFFAELELTGESSNARGSAPEQPTGEPAWDSRSDESTLLSSSR